MRLGRYLSAEDQDGSLPPSSPPRDSPPIVLPSSPLTVLDESQDYVPTVHTSSPLSQAESPVPCSPVQAASSLALSQSQLLSVGGSEGSFVLSSPVRKPGDMMRKSKKQQEEKRKERARQDQEDEERKRTMAFKESLSTLTKNKLTFAELTQYVLFQEDQTTTKQQYESLLTNKDLITRMLNLFASSKANKGCQRAVKEWAESTVQQALTKEVNAATRSGDLWMIDREIDSSFASGLGFEELRAMVRRRCPLFLRLLVNVITTDRQMGSSSNKLIAKEHVRIAVS